LRWYYFLGKGRESEGREGGEEKEGRGENEEREVVGREGRGKVASWLWGMDAPAPEVKRSEFFNSPRQRRTDTMTSEWS